MFLAQFIMYGEICENFFKQTVDIILCCVHGGFTLSTHIFNKYFLCDFKRPLFMMTAIEC